MSAKMIRGLEVLGNSTMNRRDALTTLGFGAAGLVGSTVLGATTNNVGLTGEFNDAPFRSIGGYLEENGKLILPSGQSIIVGQYGNPTLAPAAFHATPLANLDPSIVDLGSLSNAFNLAAGSSAQQKLGSLRAYCFLLKDGDHYKEIDLSQQLESPPAITIAANGAIQIQLGERTIVNQSDGVFLRRLYHSDIGRIDQGAVVAICECGTPPSKQEPITVSELGTPLLVSTDSLAGFKGAALEKYSVAALPVNAEQVNGTLFIRSGDNVWRYRYSPGKDNVGSILEVDCKPHLGLEDENWDQMGSQNFYQLIQESGRTVINPEPHRKNTMDISHLNPNKGKLFGTGLVLWDTTNGQITKERTSLTKLAKTAKVEVIGDKIRVDQISGPNNGNTTIYQIVELRQKPGFASNTVDVYAINLSGAPKEILPLKPALTRIGSFDFEKAYRDTQKLFQSLGS